MHCQTFWTLALCARFGFALRARNSTASSDSLEIAAEAWDASLEYPNKYEGPDGGILRQQTALSRAGREHTTRLNGLQWLHIPKTGTSFAATLWGFACGQGALPIDLNVDTVAHPACLACYDWSLQSHYPRSKYCTAGVLHSMFQTGHLPTSVPQMNSGQNVVGFFRQPNQRLISAHNNGYHSAGFGPTKRQELNTKCGANRWGPGGKAASIKCYATFPGIAGCMTRMLTGGMCAQEAAEAPSVLQQRVPQALAAIDKMAFVGITGQWDESVCLFHLMFGGDVYPAEFKNFHHGAMAKDNGPPLYDESPLAGFVDTADERVYAKAMARFAALRNQYAGPGKMACDALNLGAAETTLHPLSCQETNAECGHVEGPAGHVNCGDCPEQRLAFLDRGTFQKKFFGFPQTLQCQNNACLVDGAPNHELFKWNNFAH